MQEIERKFLVRDMPDLSELSQFSVRQGYITHPTDAVEMRLRQKNQKYYLTFKTGEGTVRTEREAEITKAQFEIFWPETEGRWVEKTRWVGELFDGLQFELDEFYGALAGLVLVEVEFPSLTAAHSFVPPDWFGRDVSENGEYRNKNLAIHGLVPKDAGQS